MSIRKRFVARGIPRAGRFLGGMAALCILLLSAAPAGAAEGAEALQRRESLRLGNTEARRESAAWLGLNASAESVPALIEALRDRDRAVRVLSENSMWSIWMRSGDEAVDQQIRAGAELLQGARYQEALAIFEQVVAQAPEFAEGYNKRATALYYLGDYQRSLADIRETLARNPYHFGALSGAGLCWMALREASQALLYFERALAINPNLAGIRDMVQQLKRITKEQVM